MGVTMSKEARALIVNHALDKAGIQNWGRAGIIKKAMSCSPATASGWLNGTLPKDAHQLLNFANTYGLNVDLWVNGESKEGGGITITEQKVENVCSKLREYEVDNDIRLTPKKFSQMFTLYLSSPEKASFMLKHVGVLLSE